MLEAKYQAPGRYHTIRATPNTVRADVYAGLADQHATCDKPPAESEGAAERVQSSAAKLLPFFPPFPELAPAPHLHCAARA